MLRRTIEAVSEVVVDGVNRTEMVQVPAGASERLLVQVAADTAKSAAFGPLILTALDEARIRFAVPELVTVTVSAELVVPWTIGPKFSDEGASVAAGVKATIVALVCAEFALVPAELKAFTT